MTFKSVNKMTASLKVLMLV